MAHQDVLADILDAVPLLLTTAVARRAPHGMTIQFRGRAYDFRGPQVFEVLSAIAPRMSGVRRLGEICGDLVPEQRRVAVSLVRHLLEKDIAVDCAREAAAEEEAGLQEFQGQLLFARHFVPDATRRFLRLRRSRVVLAGGGDTLAALAVSLLRNGFEKVLVEESVWSNPRVNRALLEECKLGGVAPRFESVDRSVLASQGDARIAAVCYAAEEPALRTAQELSMLCRRHDVPFVPGIFLGGKAFVGPMATGRKGPCWFCFLQRYIDNATAAERASIWKRLAVGERFDDRKEAHNPVACRILANGMGLELFKMIMGYGRREMRRQALAMDWSSLQSVAMPVSAYPGCPICADTNARADRDWLMTAVETAEETAGQDTTAQGARAERIGSLVNPVTGVAAKFDDGALVQTPLFRTLLLAGSKDDSASAPFPGYSLDSNAAARVAAVRNFARAYSASVADERRMVGGDDLEAVESQGVRRIRAPDLSHWLGGGGEATADASRRWMYALSRRTRVLHLVPTGSVYPSVARGTGEFEDVALGIGVGFSFREACEDAEERRVAHELLKDASRGRSRWAACSLASARELSRDIRYLADVLDRLGHSASLVSSEWYAEGGYILAFSESSPRLPSSVIVGHGASRLNAAEAALRELLAVLTGGVSTCTLEDYLPARLGYDLTPWERVQVRLGVAGPAASSLSGRAVRQSHDRGCCDCWAYSRAGIGRDGATVR
jgi:bacteriocin biosynthesis cyclodehydratase domain-containing protein